LLVNRRHLLSLIVLVIAGHAAASDSSAADNSPRELVTSAKRIVFLGDSITHAGDYVAGFDAWLVAQKLEHPPTVIDVGLPSETVSGLSEEGHAGGAFPRPDLAERLTRVLKVTKPDLVFACYGINCGIYKPFDEGRFAKYQKGITSLKEQVEAAGAKFVVITPPYYDDQRAKGKFSYNEVLDRYSAWLVAQRENGWNVVDLHSAMTAAVAQRRKESPDFTFQPDAVHPNAEGQWFMATQLIAWCGDDAAAAAKSPQEMLALYKLPPDVLQLVRRRKDVLRDAYLSAAGHKRPGIGKGLPVAEAEEQAAALSQKVQEVVRPSSEER
jgi:lysophospholipase L1-like esterase